MLNSERNIFIGEFNNFNTEKQVKDLISLLLPKFIKEKIEKGNTKNIQELQNNIGLIYIDIMNFDSIINEEQEQAIYMLDLIFKDIDEICQQFFVQKIETVGKTYLGAIGLKDSQYQSNSSKNSTIVEKSIEFSFEVQKILSKYQFGQQNQKRKNVVSKISIEYGSVVAGLVGSYKPQFILIGNTINRLKLIGKHSLEGMVTISENAYQEIKNTQLFLFQDKVINTKLFDFDKNIIAYEVIPKKQAIDIIINKETMNHSFKNNDQRRQSIKQLKQFNFRSNAASEIKLKVFNEYAKQGQNDNLSNKNLSIIPSNFRKSLQPVNEHKNSSFSVVSKNSSSPRDITPSNKNSLKDFTTITDQILSNLEEQAQDNIEMEKHWGTQILNFKVDIQNLIQQEQQESSDQLQENKWILGGKKQFSTRNEENISKGLQLNIIKKNQKPLLYKEFIESENEIFLDYYKNIFNLLIFYILCKMGILFILIDDISSVWIILCQLIRLIFLLIIITIRFNYQRITNWKGKSVTTFFYILCIIFVPCLNIEIYPLKMASEKYTDSNQEDAIKNEIIFVYTTEKFMFYIIFTMYRNIMLLQKLSLSLIIFTSWIISCTFFQLISLNLLYYYLMIVGIYLLFEQKNLEIYLQQFNTERNLAEKKEQSEQLLNYLVPHHLLEQFLINPQETTELIEVFNEIPIIIVDIYGFQRFAKSAKPDKVLKLLRKVFGEYDKICSEFGVFKLYTVDDMYIGLIIPENHDNNNNVDEDPAGGRKQDEEVLNLIQMAEKMRDILNEVKHSLNINFINIRIGIHIGTILGGIVGQDVMRYDIYGKDVVKAHECLKNGAAGQIVVTEQTKIFIERNFEDQYAFLLKDEIKLNTIYNKRSLQKISSNLDLDQDDQQYQTDEYEKLPIYYLQQQVDEDY